MEQGIKAIETEYNGYKFRSRLEARWAVFFDALGVKYQYEPEGYKTDNKNYLPDFKIKCYGTRGSISNEPFDLFIEVKGVMTQADAEKIIALTQDNGYGEITTYQAARQFPSILIVGDIPNPEEYEAQSYDLKCYEKMNNCDIYPWNYATIDGDHFGAYPAVDDKGHFYLDGDDGHYQTMDLNIIRDAFREARYARFEHGETPAALDVRRRMLLKQEKRSFVYKHEDDERKEVDLTILKKLWERKQAEKAPWD